MPLRLFCSIKFLWQNMVRMNKIFVAFFVVEINKNVSKLSIEINNWRITYATAFPIKTLTERVRH